jgi:hypothetical protein
MKKRKDTTAIERAAPGLLFALVISVMLWVAIIHALFVLFA